MILLLMFTIYSEMLVTSMLRRMKQCAGLHLHSRITNELRRRNRCIQSAFISAFMGVFAFMENAFRRLFEPAFDFEVVI